MPFQGTATPVIDIYIFPAYQQFKKIFQDQHIKKHVQVRYISVSKAVALRYPLRFICTIGEILTYSR